VISDIGIATGESIGRRDLAGVTVPVVCTAGALSRPYMRRLVRHLASSLPRGTYVEVPDAGHGAVFEQPRAMATLTMELVQEINPRHRVA
jgi:pimeloyl-ACP methyl ester carboxylesterase